MNWYIKMYVLCFIIVRVLTSHLVITLYLSQKKIWIRMDFVHNAALFCFKKRDPQLGTAHP